MASVDWQKATTQKAGAMIKHNGKAERVAVKHSNKDIDTSKSHLNIYIGADDYKPMLDKVKERIKEVDKKYPPKRDMGDRRITCILLEVPVPQGIADKGKAEDFLRKSLKVIEDFFGAENVGGLCGHFDEQHPYTDKDGQEKISLIHGHIPVAAYAEWTDKKTGEKRCGINGKHCETRERLTALNKAMDEMCIREYSISYNTGETPERKSVERLKRETELRAEEDRLKKNIQEKTIKLDELEKDVIMAEAQSEIAQKEAEELSTQVNELTTARDETTAENERLKVEHSTLSADNVRLKTENESIEVRNKEIKTQGDDVIAAITKAKANTAAEVERGQKLRQDNDDFVMSLQPIKEKTVTHKVKTGVFKTEEVTETVPLTAQELEFNRALQAAQAVIRSDEQRKAAVAAAEKEAIARLEARTDLTERRTAALQARASISPAFKAKYSQMIPQSQYRGRRERDESELTQSKQNSHNTSKPKQVERD